MVLDEPKVERITRRELDDASELLHQKNYPGSTTLSRKTEPGPELTKILDELKYKGAPQVRKTGPVPAEQEAKLKKAKAEDEVIIARRNSANIGFRAIPYLWRGVIPTHMATAITGDPGLGKTLVAVDIASRVSRGKPFPLYDKPGPTVHGRVFYVTSEGVPEMILVPRLHVAGADLNKIDVIEGVCIKRGIFSIFDITRHLPQMEEDARKCPELKLIVIDPIASFMPATMNTNQMNQVRVAMDLLSNLAHRLGVAIVVVMHFAKAADPKAINRTSGSAQFMASVKMSWSVIKQPQDPPDMRVFVPQKSNITAGRKSLGFDIEPLEFIAPNGELVETARIKWQTDLIDKDPNTLICPPQENTDIAEAMAWLKPQLKVVRDGEVLDAAAVIEEAKHEGIAPWTIQKARKRLGLASYKEGKFQGCYFWFFPKEQP